MSNSVTRLAHKAAYARAAKIALLVVWSLGVLSGASAHAAQVWLVEVEGAIGPASSDYFIRTLERAEADNAELVVMRLDTPGGLDRSMRDMIKAILASRVPVATYVAPNGSRAASAGTYILYASHIAAMAPATNVGSSTPVSMEGGTPFPFPTPTQPQDEEGEAPDQEGEQGVPAPKTAMERKVINDAVAYIRGLAELHDRNADWAERTVREAANLTASQALEQNVIDLIAVDLEELLAKLDGRIVTVAGEQRTLALAGATIVRIEPDWRHEFLALITDPNIAYILLMIGIYGLILEFYNPGLGIPGVTGVICLLLAAFALQLLPINYVGLALMLIGVGLMVAEALSPSFGVLGVGGVVAFVFGSIMLMDTDLPGYQISVPIIAAFAAASLGLLVFAIGAAIRARREPVTTGKQAMVGASAVVLEDFENTGHVIAFGEIWHASAETPLCKGDEVRIIGVDGLDLKVEPMR